MASRLRGAPRWNRFVGVLACIAGLGVTAAQVRPQREPPPAGIADGEPVPPRDPVEPPDTIPITGVERLAWEFEAKSGEEASSVEFVALIDDVATDLHGVSCHAIAGPLQLTCASPLPPMSDGVHTIEVAARADGLRLGPRSVPIRVFLQSASSVLQSAARHDVIVTARDGLRLRAIVVATGLIDPTDLAVVADGRVLIAERTGRIRVFSSGHLRPTPGITLFDATIGHGHGILALAVDSGFERTHAVYALYTSGTAARLARFTLHMDTLVDRAVLLDGLPIAPSWPKATLRIGPNQSLFLALDDGGEPDRADDLGSYSGKVLKLKTDGTTADQQGSSPVFIGGIHRPAGIAWQRGGSSSWIVTTDSAGAEFLYSVRSESSGRARIVARQALPDGSGAADVMLYDAPTIPQLQGNLLVAADAGKAILRFRPDDTGQSSIEWLLRDVIGSIRALGQAPDGAIYVLTQSALVRLQKADGESRP